MESFEIVVDGEVFRVSERAQPSGATSYDFSWLNGPAQGTYGFTIGLSSGSTVATEGDAAAPPAGLFSAERLVAEAQGFVKSFYEAGGIGETDFPDHVPANPDL